LLRRSFLLDNGPMFKTINRLVQGKRTPLALLISIVVPMLLLSGCQRQKLVVDFQSTIMYEKPQITLISYSVVDQRREGGAAVVKVIVAGDPALNGSFDISPGIAVREPLTETVDGNYVGEFALPLATTGGPFTIIGRLEHETAGEVILTDPTPLILSLIDNRPR
jgi:hypothetical protein